MLLSLRVVIPVERSGSAGLGLPGTGLSPPRGLAHGGDLGTGAAGGGGRKGEGCGICARGRAVLSWEPHSPACAHLPDLGQVI